MLSSRTMTLRPYEECTSVLRAVEPPSHEDLDLTTTAPLSRACISTDMARARGPHRIPTNIVFDWSIKVPTELSPFTDKAPQTDKERHNINNRIQHNQERLAAFADELSVAQSRSGTSHSDGINTLSAQQANLEKQIKDDISLLAPIRRLPFDVLLEIFYHHVFTNDQLPEKLLFVCRIWHLYATRMPLLWRNLDPVKVLNLARPQPWYARFVMFRIARSHPAPLDIDFRSTHPCHFTANLVRRFARIDGFLPRIRSIVIDRDPLWLLLDGKQPLLQEITLGSFNWDENITFRDWDYDPDSLPNLRSLNLINASQWGLPNELLSRLTDLRFQQPTAVGIVVIDNNAFSPMRRMVDAAKSVERLKISLDPYDNHIASSDNPIIPFINRTLLELEISYGEDCRRSNVFSEMELPALQSLKIMTYSVVDLQYLYLKNTSNVNSFWLHSHCQDMGDPLSTEQGTRELLRVLRTLPGVEQIGIYAHLPTIQAIVTCLENDPKLCPRLSDLRAGFPTEFNTDIDPEGGEYLPSQEVGLVEPVILALQKRVTIRYNNASL